MRRTLGTNLMCLSPNRGSLARAYGVPCAYTITVLPICCPDAYNTISSCGRTVYLLCDQQRAGGARRAPTRARASPARPPTRWRCRPRPPREPSSSSSRCRTPSSSVDTTCIFYLYTYL